MIKIISKFVILCEMLNKKLSFEGKTLMWGLIFKNFNFNFKIYT